MNKAVVIPAVFVDCGFDRLVPDDFVVAADRPVRAETCQYSHRIRGTFGRRLSLSARSHADYPL
jgi:hypothetical protein